MTVSNLGEPAYFAWLHLNFSRVFSFVGRSDTGTDILCDLVEDTSIACNLGNPFLRRTESLQFKLVPRPAASLPGDVMFTTNISTTSLNTPPPDQGTADPASGAASLTSSTQFTIVRRSEVSIRGSVRPEAILYGGQVVGESAIRDIAEIGSKVIHTFHVVNDGPWQADSVNVHIDWPYQVKNTAIAMTHDTILIPPRQVESGSRQGKWLLYLTEGIEVSPPGVGQCFINPRNINFLGLRQRQQELVTQPPPPGPPVTSQGNLREGAAYNSISSGEQGIDIM